MADVEMPAVSARMSSAMPDWQRLLADGVRTPSELLALVQVSPESLVTAYGLPGAQLTTPPFGLLVPRGFVARMRKNDPLDPLLRQVLPIALETHEAPGFSADPVGDQAAMIVPGVLHKYFGRVLFIVNGACAIHCRYCFRREFPYSAASTSPSQIDGAVRYVASDASIEEVILSGGDPLTMRDRDLRELIGMLASIPHVTRIRVHTRLPVVIPERITVELVQALESTRLLPVVVIHANHGNEIDDAVISAMTKVRRAGIALLNQAVLLRGVNDSVEALRDLSERLFAAGVLPYYLHLLDRVRGSAHFEVTDVRARELMSDLMRYLPGYLVPRLVREVQGLPFKEPINFCVAVRP